MIENLEKQLYNKLDKEWNKYLNEFLKLSKEELINRSYEIATIKELKNFYFNIDEYNFIELKAVVEEENLLDTLYDYCLKFDDTKISYAIEIAVENITDKYVNTISEEVENSSRCGLVEDVCKLLNDSGDNDNLNFIKEKLAIEEFSKVIVYLLLNERNEIKNLYNCLLNEKNIKDKNIRKKVLSELKKEMKQSKNKER